MLPLFYSCGFLIPQHEKFVFIYSFTNKVVQQSTAQISSVYAQTNTLFPSALRFSIRMCADFVQANDTSLFISINSNGFTHKRKLYHLRLGYVPVSEKWQQIKVH
jgi:hypothetical protein